jgi:V8-like Glu-specific endopeptidase
LILPALTTLVVGAGAVFLPSAFAAAPAPAPADAPETGAAETSAAPADPAVRVRPVRKTPRQLRALWTPERLREAADNPVDAPVARPGVAPKVATNSALAEEPTQTASAAAVPPKNAAAKPNSAVSAQATVSASQRVSNVSTWPTSAVGRLYFMNEAETEWFTCTATAISTRNKNAAWTAGHCLHRGSGGNAGWFTNHIFIPAYDGRGSNTYGWWYGASLIASDAWTNRGDTKDSDMGAIILTPPGSATLEDTVGAWGYTFGGSTAYANVRTYGYPEKGYNRPAADFAGGEHMMFCEGNTIDSATSSATDDRLKMSCDMGAGSSGGPLATGIGTTNIRIVGTNSHRESDSKGVYVNNWLFSSNHNGIAVSVINRINNS